MMRWPCSLLVVILFALSALSPAQAAEPPVRPWAVTGYGVVLSADSLAELAWDPHFEGSYQLAVLALSRALDRQWLGADLEWEAQLGKHYKGQDHWELNGLLAGRWSALPWDDWLDSSLALGAGLSLASEDPEFERNNHTRVNDLVGYLLVELEADPFPAHPLSLVMRLHHRSGLYGTFDGVDGASNALGVGIKYRF